MRLYPPSTALFTRVARRDLVIGETPVSKGTLVVVPIWHLHHDARSFAEPNTFRPDRFMPDAPAIPRSAYLPFGAGPHFCLGQNLATIDIASVAPPPVKNFALSLDRGTALPEPAVELAQTPKNNK